MLYGHATTAPDPASRPAGPPPSPAHALMREQARLARAQADALEFDTAERRAAVDAIEAARLRLRGDDGGRGPDQLALDVTR